MLSSLFPGRMPSWLDTGLDRIEQLVWKHTTDVDSKSEAFYVYRAYPSSIKSAQLNDWIALQKRSLSPFKAGDVYIYASAKGIALWATPGVFSGIPETAMQSALGDGIHLVRGAHLTYRQVWRDGVMTEMTCTDADSADTQLSSLKGSPWAKVRQIDRVISSPLSWFCAAAAIFCLSLFATTGSWLGITQQLSNYEATISELESTLGDKLALQTRYQQYEQLLSGVNQWQYQAGQLPETLASVIGPVLSQTQWAANVIAWQDNELTVELASQDLDIAALVQALESRTEFSNVSIRPHTTPNTWNLEVTVNED